jgi:hypothetical protein
LGHYVVFYLYLKSRRDEYSKMNTIDRPDAQSLNSIEYGKRSRWLRVLAVALACLVICLFGKLPTGESAPAGGPGLMAKLAQIEAQQLKYSRVDLLVEVNDATFNERPAEPTYQRSPDGSSWTTQRRVYAKPGENPTLGDFTPIKLKSLEDAGGEISTSRVVGFWLTHGGGDSDRDQFAKFQRLGLRIDANRLELLLLPGGANGIVPMQIHVLYR